MADISKVVLLIEYDGSSYHGFQLQANASTVQAELERALLKLTGENIRVLAASRTDAGVHAKGQVVSFRTKSALPLAAFVRGLNYYLPADIAVTSAHTLSMESDIRRLATRREYRYSMLNSPVPSPLRRRYSYFFPRKLDVETMRQACSLLVGEHDFVSFASALEERMVGRTVRQVYKAEIDRKGDLLTFDVAANSFLPHQIRNTVGALIRVGLGKMKIDEFRQMAEARKPGLAGPAAPAHGLCLMKVSYPFPFGA